MANDKNKYSRAAEQQVIDDVIDSEDLQSILIDIEDYLDTSNIYVFKNWIKGSVVDGPYVSKYWVRVVLKWKYKDMPDPSGAARLTPHGTLIKWGIGHEDVPQPIKTPSDYRPGTVKPKLKKEKIWLVDISIPRKFIENLSREVMDLYDDDIDIDTANDADAEGLNDEFKQ